jgi:hypothetical protein
LVQGKHLSVDGSFVQANAAKETRIPREQLAEAGHLPDEAPDLIVSPNTGFLAIVALTDKKWRRLKARQSWRGHGFAEAVGSGRRYC